MTATITDFSQYSTLRAGAERNDPAVLREVAGQFEALFLQTMLKSMRDASFGDPLFGDSHQHEMYQDMLDQQLALNMSSGKGIGLADMLVRQLGSDPVSSGAAGSFNLPAPVASRTPEVRQQPLWDSPDAFVRDVWPHAERAARRLNVAPEAVMAQAALETGWGTHVPQTADGQSSFNLFGIKAGGSWSGPSASKPTLEFEAGVATRQVAKFRAYDDVAATFNDYADLLADNPRYERVAGHGNDIDGFARALQDAGYATDPDYASKLSRVAGSETMREALQQFKPLTRTGQLPDSG